MIEISEIEERMNKSVSSLESEFATIRAGRANPHILDRVMVDYYGVPTAIQQAANISVPEARMIQIQPWDASLIKEIEKAIMIADLGVMQQTMVRLSVSSSLSLQRTEERNLLRKLRKKAKKLR